MIYLLTTAVAALAAACGFMALETARIDRRIKERLESLETMERAAQNQISTINLRWNDATRRMNAMETGTKAMHQDYLERQKDIFKHLLALEGRMKEVETQTEATNKREMEMLTGMQNIMDYNLTVARGAVSDRGEK